MLSRIFFIAVLCLCLAAVPVMAQDAPTPTAQPEQRFILSWSAEVIFPSAIRFVVTLGRPLNQLTSADLLIQYENSEAITLPVNLKGSATIEEPYSQLAYIWSIPTNNPPHIFHDITFKWRVISIEGEAALITDAVNFRDARAEWLLDQSIGSNIKYIAASDDPLVQIQNTVKPIYDLLASNTGTNLSYQVFLNHLPDCVLNATNEAVAVGVISETEVPCNPQTANAIFQASEYDLVKSASGDIIDIQNAFAAYLTGKFYTSRWSGKAVPAWFQSGLGLFYSPASKTAYGLPVTNAARTNALYSLVAMNTPPTNSADADSWTAQSYGMVVYIASQIGVEGLFNLANAVGNAASFADAYRAAMGQPIESLLPDMSRWIFTNAGLAAFSFTPYQAATATPTATITQTPTRTPTATATNTSTPTATVTGLLSLTPRPTHTATRRPTSAPATRTPRPPGSLNTATATPVPPTALAQAAENPRVGVFVLIVGLIIIAMSAVVYRMFRGK